MNAGDGKAEQWLIAFTTALRAELPQGEYILTHAREFHFLCESSKIDIRHLSCCALVISISLRSEVALNLCPAKVHS